MSFNTLFEHYSKVLTEHHNGLNPLEPHTFLINTCIMHDIYSNISYILAWWFSNEMLFRKLDLQFFLCFVVIWTETVLKHIFQG